MDLKKSFTEGGDFRLPLFCYLLRYASGPESSLTVHRQLISSCLEKDPSCSTLTHFVRKPSAPNGGFVLSMLDEAVYYGRDPVIVDMLIKAGAKITAGTLLWAIGEAVNIEVVKTLVVTHSALKDYRSAFPPQSCEDLMYAVTNLAGVACGRYHPKISAHDAFAAVEIFVMNGLNRNFDRLDRNVLYLNLLPSPDEPLDDDLVIKMLKVYKVSGVCCEGRGGLRRQPQLPGRVRSPENPAVAVI